MATQRKNVSPVDVINDTAAAVMAAASGRVAERGHTKAVQPVINELWAKGGRTRDMILRIADRVAAECGDNKDLKNAALSILRVRASRAQKEAGDPEQGITLRSGVAQWGNPKTPKVRDYVGEALALMAKAAEAGQATEPQVQAAASALLTVAEPEEQPAPVRERRTRRQAA